MDSKTHSIVSTVELEAFVTIIGVTAVFSCHLCFKCGGLAVIDDVDSDMAQYDDCNTLQFLEDTKMTTGAQFTIKTRKGQVIDVTAHELFEKNAGRQYATKKLLLKSQPFTMKHTFGLIKCHPQLKHLLISLSTLFSMSYPSLHGKLR